MRIPLIIAALLVLVPVLWAFMNSIRKTNEYTANPWGLPTEFHFQNYINAWNSADMGSNFINSIMITLFSLILLLILVVPLAYGVSRFKFRFRKPISFVIMAGLFVNPTYIVVPLFLMLNNVGGINNRLWMVILYGSIMIPFNCNLLMGFLQGISHEYDAAAQIDGCGYWSTMLRIILPMAKPGFITLLTFGFMNFWNEYVLSFTFINSDGKRTLPIGLQNLMVQARFATDWGQMFAGMCIVMVPTLIFYSLVQKKLTAGLSLGGLKG